MRKAFIATDVNGDGFISESELWTAIKSGTFVNMATDSKVQEAIAKADKDESGRFDYCRKYLTSKIQFNSDVYFGSFL